MRFLQEDSMNEQEIKEQLCDVCHKMWQLGWVAANDGNVSVKQIGRASCRERV